MSYGESPGRAASVGAFLTWWVVPIWVLTGALFKLFDGGAAALPVVLVRTLGAAGVDLEFALHFAVGFELAAVGVIWLVRPLARPAVLAVLGLFAAILVGDLLLGASNCGCFGAMKVHPAITLVVDGGLLLGVLLLGRRPGSPACAGGVPVGRVLAAVLWILASFAVAFGVPAHRGPASENGGQAVASAPTPERGASTAAVPSYYLPDYGAWIGKRWTDLDIAGWVRGGPAQLDQGARYLVLYRKDCEHCHLLFELYFSDVLPYPTTLIAVPERAGFPTQDVQDVPCTECTFAELPTGCDWFFQTPVVIKLVDGTVECAVEENPEAPQCIDW